VDRPWDWLRRKRILALALFVSLLSIVGILRSESRGSLAAGLVLVVGFIVIKLAKSRLAVLGGVAILGVLAVALGELGMSAFFDAFAKKHVNLEYSGGRVELWRFLIDRWLSEAPVFGFGHGAS